MEDDSFSLSLSIYMNYSNTFIEFYQVIRRTKFCCCRSLIHESSMAGMKLDELRVATILTHKEREKRSVALLPQSKLWEMDCVPGNEFQFWCVYINIYICCFYMDHTHSPTLHLQPFRYGIYHMQNWWMVTFGSHYYNGDLYFIVKAGFIWWVFMRVDQTTCFGLYTFGYFGRTTIGVSPIYIYIYI